MKKQNQNIQALHDKIVQAGLDPATLTINQLSIHLLRKRAVKWGRKGGKAGTGKAKARTRAQARAAARARWAKVKTATKAAA